MVDKRIMRRIGILDFTSSAWAAGGIFTGVLTWSLANACKGEGTEVVMLSDNEENIVANRLPVKVLHVPHPLLGPSSRTPQSFGQGWFRRLQNGPDRSHSYNAYVMAQEHGISVLLPPGAVPDWTAGVKTIGWIPDFQHVYLPGYFTETERVHRDTAFRTLAQRADLVLLSSKTALDHFSTFAHDYERKARVVSFPSIFAFEPPCADPSSSTRLYNLPDKFALVANQLWVHKNHEIVVAALSRLRRKGIRIPVVMTGLPADHRDPLNQRLSQLLQEVAQGDLTGQVTFLGQVHRKILIDLMRVATIIIQPSRFEGWSTVVQDAKALGRPLLCSDIPVHREQAPDAMGFFPCDEPEVLADLLASHWGGLNPGPNTAIEQQALMAEREFAYRHGRSLLQVCREVSPV